MTRDVITCSLVGVLFLCGSNSFHFNVLHGRILKDAQAPSCRRSPSCLYVTQDEQHQQLEQQEQREQHEEEGIMMVSVNTTRTFMDIVITEGMASSIQAGSTKSVHRFGDVVPMKRPATRPTENSQSSAAPTISNNLLLSDGDFSSTASSPKAPMASSSSSSTSADELIQQSKFRNSVVAVASVLLAVSSYLYQFTHPVEPVQLLYTMQQNSQSMSVIGVNQKPTVVDFWAPWCDNCKLIAPTLLQVEEEYKDRVNFVMVDGDKAESWPYIEAFGVDAIPHLALVSADGDVETALIGPIPRHVLKADLDVLLENAAATQNGNNNNKDNNEQSPRQSLPYTMLDVFASNPQGRKVRFQ